MKAFQFSSFKQHLTPLLILLSIPMILISCANMDAVHESPMRFGWGLSTAPGLQVGNGNASVHALLAYGRVKLSGYDGHNNFWQFGGQFRWSFADKPTVNGFWAGGELAYLYIRNKYDNLTLKQTASGCTIGLLGGYKFFVGKTPLSFYFAPAFLARGKFKNNGVAYGEGHTGILARIGFDIHWASLLSKKGR